MARFTFLLPVFSLNGGSKVVAQYAHALRGQGHQVQIVARAPARPSFRDLLRGRARLQLWQTAPRDFFVGLDDCIHVFPSWRSIASDDLPDADFLVCTWWETVEWALSMPNGKGRLVHLMQGYEMFPYLPLERVAETYRAPTLKIAVSQWIARQVLINHGSETTAIVHNAVDLNQFALRERTDNSVLTLGFMYSSAQIKNPELPFALADSFAEQGKDLQLVSFGKSPLPSHHASRSNLCFHFQPDQDNIPAIYQSCDLWLFPSFEEGFGLPLLESLACGTPVVSGPAGAAPELMKEGINGYLTGSDIGSFSAALHRYIELDDQARVAMRRNARETVNNWTWEDAARAFLKAIERGKV